MTHTTPKPAEQIPFKPETWPVDADGFAPFLCTVCGTPVRYGSRHSQCAPGWREPAPKPQPQALPELPTDEQIAQWHVRESRGDLDLQEILWATSEGDLSVKEALHEVCKVIRAALASQPPAPADAQPVAWVNPEQLAELARPENATLLLAAASERLGFLQQPLYAQPPSPQPEPANSPAMVRKSLSATVADALRPFLGAGQKVIWREPFRWHDDDGVMSNHYDGMSLAYLGAEFDYEVIEDCGCAGIIQRRTKS